MAILSGKRLGLYEILSAIGAGGMGENIFYADYVEESGVGLYTAVCERDCEGVVGKHKLGPYTSAPMSWFKIINPNYSQHVGRREMFDRFRDRRNSKEIYV